LGENPLSWQPCQGANSRGLANENSTYPKLVAQKGLIVVTLQQIYTTCTISSGKAGAVWIYTAPTLILKYENIKFKKKESQAEEAQNLNYRIKS
jgi:hypothetical protein